MAQSPTHENDLEDGEIESDEEVSKEVQEETVNNVKVEENLELKAIQDLDNFHPKLAKRKKSKFSRNDKFKQRTKKNDKRTSLQEEDFASTVEKAIRKAMNKDEDDDKYEEDNEGRKDRKRKRKNNKEDLSRKRNKKDYVDEMDESEMLCVRGASPVRKDSPQNVLTDHEKDSFYSDSSVDSKNITPRNKSLRNFRDRSKNGKERKRSKLANNVIQDPDDVCVYFMQGKCPKGDDCIYSHNAQPPRKMELCKFYLMDCCAKRDKCLYMHSDFPCKYYHTGLPCVYKDECKFAHGEPLSDCLRNILLKHIESAPKEILGDFPRLNRDGAMKMIQTMQMRLTQQNTDRHEKTIPSLFDIDVPTPEELLHFPNERHNKTSPKTRQSRWQNNEALKNFSNNIPNNVLSIKNLTGMLTPLQIADLTKMGIENLDQLSQLTVLQLNSIGISLKQITDIQLNTINIQKLGLISNTVEQSSPVLGSISNSKDMDLRVPPLVSTVDNRVLLPNLPEKDVDMRLNPSVVNDVSSKNVKNDTKSHKDMIDIDQYTKDALKFVAKDKHNILVADAPQNEELPMETKDVDHRVLSFSESEQRHLSNDTSKNEYDTDIRFLQPKPLFKNPATRSRLSTTDDDEENNLFIDEKWYSSDEEKLSKKKSPLSSPLPNFYSPKSTNEINEQTNVKVNEEASNVVSKLGDLSKIDISEEVTKLLNSMKNKSVNYKGETSEFESNVSTDSSSRRSPEKVTVKRRPKVSIYECIDGEPTDGRRRTDVDLRKSDFLPALGDMDLRQSSSGDIDFRLGLPFKPIPNYTPASEIDGSINSHPPMSFKLTPISIPRPDYTDIKNSTAKSQALVDPRLRKVFRLSLEESLPDIEKPVKATTSLAPREDPRKNRKNSIEISNPEDKGVDLQTILQNSSWYKDLSSTQKIFVNQNLAPVTQMLKQYQIEKINGKSMDLAPIRNNPILCSIFGNLGITVSDEGEYKLLPKPKEPLLKTPRFMSNSNMLGINNPLPGPPSLLDVNIMNMPPMGLGVGAGNLAPNFNKNFSDRVGPTPGLLGIAPNMPHNLNNFPNPFGNTGFMGNMDSVNSDFNFVNGDPSFRGFANRGAHRNRGNDRWNRGGPDRSRGRQQIDRNNWKHDKS